MEELALDLPGRGFLDTTVVNFILDFGDQIHDGAPPPEWITERVADDVESLRYIFLNVGRAQRQFAVSPLT